MSDPIAVAAQDPIDRVRQIIAARTAPGTWRDNRCTDIYVPDNPEVHYGSAVLDAYADDDARAILALDHLAAPLLAASVALADLLGDTGPDGDGWCDACMTARGHDPQCTWVAAGAALVALRAAAEEVTTG